MNAIVARMEESIFFYLQQIEEPDKLPLNDQGDYYLLLYKATLWKTGTPVMTILRRYR